MFTAAILTFFFAWNEFVLGISLTSTDRGAHRPGRSWRSSSAPARSTRRTGAVAAASVIVTVPVIIIVLLFQRKIVAGLTSGAVKG